MKTFLMAVLAIFINITAKGQCDPGCCGPEEWPSCAAVCALSAASADDVETITSAINEAGNALSASITGKSAVPEDCVSRPGCVCPGGKVALRTDPDSTHEAVRQHPGRPAVMQH